MLKQGRTWHRANQKGSMILTVVIMIMVLFTLTTICLDVIHHSTKVSSKNVQKTQAKLTAEKVLTEFIEGYREGAKSDDATLTDDTAFGSLQKLAAPYTQTKPLVIEVEMQNNAGVKQSDFDHTFGDTELHLYKTGTGFTVESICTYSTQTQTASVVFEGSIETPYVPSYTIESQQGKLIGDNQLSAGVDGGVYLEKSTSDSNTYKKLSRSGNKAHYYSEFSVRLDDNFTLLDMKNNTGENDYTTSGYGFQQAPTLVVDGYFHNYNDSNQISTTVGKTDENKVSPTGASITKYDSKKLGNYDGFVKVDKKIILTKAGSMIFGDEAMTSTTNVIDIYSHGLMLGPVPTGKVVDGAGDVMHDFESELKEIRKVYPESTTEDGLWTAQTTGETKINGNVYIYPGAKEATQDGSITLVGHQHMKVNGDVFVKGNVYFFNEGTTDPSPIEANNIHIQGYIVIGKYDGFTSNGKAATIQPYDSTEYAIYKISGTTIKHVSGPTVDISKYLKVNGSGKIDDEIDETVVRNQFPEEGYDPQTGKSNVTRNKLGKIYKDASANDIFAMSVDDSKPGKDTTLKPAAKDISTKYADAMTRYFSTYMDGEATGKSQGDIKFTSKYKTSGGETKDVVELLSCSTSSQKYYKIHARIKLSIGQVSPAEAGEFQNIQKLGYVIDLCDEDIVIALPIGYVGAQFRIDRTNVPKDKDGKETKNPFVYFMYYDPGKMAATNSSYKSGDACLYYSGGAGAASSLKCSDGSTYKITPDGAKTLTTGYSKGYVFMGARHDPNAGGGQGVLVGDLTAVCTSTADIPTNFNTKGFQNTNVQSDIMYLVPNEIGFGMINGSKDQAGTDFGTWSGHGSGAWNLQGLVYALGSSVKCGCFETSTASDGSKVIAGLFGQIKGLSVTLLGDKKANHLDSPMKNGSLLDYVGAKNGSVSVVKLQYFIY